MKRLILILCFLVLMPFISYGANTTTPDLTNPGVLNGWTMSLDTTGVECVQLLGASFEKFPNATPYIFVGVDITAGTAQYDVESATVDNPNETGESSDLINANDLTVDDHIVGNFITPWLCVRLDSCASCTVSVVIRAGK